MFDWEHGIALHTMQGNQASSHGKGQVSLVFSSCGRKLGYILNLWQGCPFETRVCSAKSGLLSSYDGHLRHLNYVWQDHTDAFGGEAGNQASLSNWPSDIAIPNYFQEESGIITF